MYDDKYMQKIVIHDYAGHPLALSLSKQLSKKFNIYHLYFANDSGPKSDFKNNKNKNFKIMAVGKQIAYDKSNFFQRFYKDIQYGIEVRKKINIIKPDIVISANCPTFSQQSIMLAAKENNSKFIMWVQDFYSIAVHQTLKKKISYLAFLVSFLFTFLEKKQVKLADHLIIISRDFATTLHRWDIKYKKITFIPNWGNLDQINIKKKDHNFLRKYNLNKNKFRLVYVGTLALKHNPDLIVKIAEKNLDIELLISAAGSGLNNLKNTKNLPKNIKILPLQQFNIFKKILNSADFFLAMLNREASTFSVPSKILNYLCAGKPTILSAPLNNLSARIISEAKAGKAFDPSDFKKLYNFLKLLKKDKMIRNKMSKNARLYAKNNFNIKKISFKFMHIFNNLI